MPVALANTVELLRRRNILLASGFVVGMSVAMGFQPLTPVTQSFTTAGAYTYTFPRNAIFFDRIMLGGGGGGKGMALVDAWGSGGNGGNYASDTVQRGVDFAWSVTSFTGTVGAGGQGGTGSIGSGGPGATGGSTTSLVSGGTTLTAAGGAGGTTANPANVAGKSPGDRTQGGLTVTGGAQVASGNGNVPGGGGAGAIASTTPGGTGARGVAAYRAYQ